MKNVDVVIISWAKDENLLEVTKKGLNTLFESENDVIFHAFVVESNHEIVYEKLNDYNSLINHTIKTIHPKDEFGYHRYLNIGRRAGNSPYVVLCNSDLTYEKNWASSIIKVMEENPQFLSASPLCPQIIKSEIPKDINFVEGYNVGIHLAGWCIFQQRKIYDKINMLDERFIFWYCDNDYSFDIQSKGIKHCLVLNSIVNHHDKMLGKTGETLSDSKKKFLTEEQRKIFVKKWNIKS